MRFTLFSLLACLFSYHVQAETLTIGVLAFEGRDSALSRWQPTADYLSENIPSHSFIISPLTHDEFEHALNKGQLDFILTNPGHHAQLQVVYGASRLATFVSRLRGYPVSHFSSVIFTRKSTGINSLSDLKGRKLAAVSQRAFGGYQLAQYTLLRAGLDTQTDLQLVWLGFPHSDVVSAVLNGKADAGVVRSGVIEKMADRALLDIDQLTVLSPRTDDNFPLLHSADLVPEWPFARLPTTDIKLSQKVALALMRMPPSHHAAIQASGAGWTIPLSDAKVHSVLKTLQVPPYSPAPLTFSRLLDEYAHWILVIVIFILFVLGASIHLARVNQRLRVTQGLLQKSQGELEEAVRSRTAELDDTRHVLEDTQDKHQLAKRDVANTCSAMWTLHEILLREDLTAIQRVDAMIAAVREHLGAEIGLLSRVTDNGYETRSVTPENANNCSPLYERGVLKAIELHHTHQSADSPDWACHIACPVYVHGKLHCLLEFATTSKSESTPPSNLGLTLLTLTAQWITHEILQQEHQASEQAEIESVQARFQTITRRETDVLKRLIQGESTKSIAQYLNLSPKTVEMHRAHLIRKTRAKSTTELVQLAVISRLF